MRARVLPAVLLLPATLILAAPASPAPAATAAVRCVPTPEGTLPAASAAGKAYIVQRDEYNSSAAERACTDGMPDVTVDSSAISVATDGAPGAYTSVFRGCHWGQCTAGSGLPLAVTTLEAHPWRVRLTETTTWPSGGAWDDSFDIFYTPEGGSQAGTDLEMMIWLDHGGPVQPAGSVAASDVRIGAHVYDVWWSGHTVSFVLTTASTSVTGLGLGKLAAYAVARGYLDSAWTLIDVESGFELWRGGGGAKVDSLAVCTPQGC